jgi:nicotinate dehydrogenase subunit B
MTRRELIQRSSILVVGFAFDRVVKAQPAAPAKPLDPREVDSFLAIAADGSVTIYCGKIDCGTGLRIAVRQMVAEEMGLPVDRITLIEGDTALTPDQGSTGGSTGLTRGASEIRQAAATARVALDAMGPDAAKRRGAPLSLKVDPQAPLRNVASYGIVGKPLQRPDVPGKCTGRNAYLQDFVLPGMLHGRIVRPPSIGAKLVSVDASSIKGIPDVRVIRQNNFLAVVAKDEWAAVRASRELKAAWTPSATLPSSEEVEPYLRKAAIDRDQPVTIKGDTAAGMYNAAKKFSATFYWPNQAHASLGPACAVADVRDSGTTVWTCSQGPHAVRQNIAKVFGIPESKIRVIYMDGAGSYGTNGGDDAAAEAVLLSKTAGAPVRVQWMRHEEHAWAPKGPQQLLDVRAGLDAEGRLAAWENEMWVPTNINGSRPLVSVDAAGISQDHGMGAGLLTQNADPPYECANVKVTAHLLKETTLRPSNLRAPGKIANVWAVESFVNELASAAGVDPVTYRLRGLSDPRAIEAIQRAASMLDWQERPSPNRSGMGRGFAYARYKQNENYVAIALEASVDRSTGKVIVRRVACSHDCGLVVNPGALKNQIEGSILQTISRALFEETKFDTSHVTTTDWLSYPILPFHEAPDVDVALIVRPEQPLYGAGEAACAPVAAAVANAIFDAAGARMRRAPFTPERVKAAIAQA